MIKMEQYEYIRIAHRVYGKKHSSDSKIPLDPELAKEAEVDWGSAVAIMGGIRAPIKFFCMCSRYSGKHFVRVYL